MMLASLVLGCSACGCSKSSVDIKYDVDDYVSLGEYKNLEVTVEKGDQGFEDYLQQTIAYYMGYKKSSETEVKADSIINADYVGYHKGKAFDGGAARDQWIDVANCSNATSGSGYISGFTKGLVGAKVGQEVNVDVTFPKNYQDVTLAGEPCTFVFTINAIGQAYTREELTDSMVAENFSGISTVDDLVDRAKQSYESNGDSSSKSVRSAVITKLKETSVVDVPDKLLELRVDEYMDSYEKEYCSDGESLEDYLDKTYGYDIDDFRDEVTETVKDNLETELIFEAIAKREGLKVDEEGFKEYCSKLMTNNNYSNEKSLYEAYGKDANVGKKYLKKVYLANLACDLVEKSAKVTYK